VDLAKVEAVFQRGHPKTVTKIRSFVSLTVFYQRFVAEFFPR